MVEVVVVVVQRVERHQRASGGKPPLASAHQPATSERKALPDTNQTRSTWLAICLPWWRQARLSSKDAMVHNENH